MSERDPERTEAAPQAPLAATPPTTGPASRGAVARNTALLAAGTLASRVLGMVRETLIAASFDRGATDAFFLAWRLPNALRALLAEGAASAALSPVLGRALHGDPAAREAGRPPPEGDRRALRDTYAELAGAALLALALVSVAGMLLARPLFWLTASGLRGDPARFELGVALLRWLFPYIFFMGLFALGNTALRLLDRFAPGAFAPVLLNVAFVLAPFALTPLLGLLGVAPVFALVAAALLGGALQLLYLRPALRREGLTPRPVLRASPAVRRVGSLLAPLLYGQAVYQLNILLAGHFLSGLPRGAASYFSYAQRLADVPQGLFSVALAGASSAAMQTFASRGQRDELAGVYESAVRTTAAVALPFSVLLAVYAEAVAPLVFGYGRFLQGGDGAAQVAASLRWQAIAVALNAFVQQTTAVFGVLEQRAQVVRCATAGLLTFAAVSAYATPRLGHAGVAVAMVASSAVQLALLLRLLRALVPARFERVLPALARALAATGVMALCARAAVLWLPVTGTSLRERALAVLCGAALVGVYLAAAWQTGSDEVRALGAKVRARLRRRPR